MKTKKRNVKIISIFLAMTLLIGLLPFNISDAQANVGTQLSGTTIKGERKIFNGEPSVTFSLRDTNTESRKARKVNSFSSLLSKSSTTSALNEGEYSGYSVKFNWYVYDRPIDTIEIKLVDYETGTVCAIGTVGKEDLGNKGRPGLIQDKIVKLYKTKDFIERDSIEDYDIIVPDEYDISVDLQKYDNYFETPVNISFYQIPNSLYRSDWHDRYSESINKRPDNVKGYWKALNVISDFKLSQENNKYFSALALNTDEEVFTYNGEHITVYGEDDRRGSVPLDSVLVRFLQDPTDNCDRGILINGQPQLLGKWDNPNGTGPNYYFNVTGDYKTETVFSMQEQLKVTFNQGENGTIAGATDGKVSYNIGYGDSITANNTKYTDETEKYHDNIAVPEVTVAQDGKYEFANKWKMIQNGTEIKEVTNDQLLSEAINDDTEFVALYNNQGDIIPIDPDSTETKEGYARVNFLSGDGSLSGLDKDGNQATDVAKLSYLVKDGKTWNDFVGTVPKAKANDSGKLHNGWTPGLPKSETAFVAGETGNYTAQYLAPIAKADLVFTKDGTDPEAKDLIANTDEETEGENLSPSVTYEFKEGFAPDLTEITNKKTATVVLTDESGNKVEVSVPYKVIDKVSKVEPVDPTKPFDPSNNDDTNNNRKTDENQVRIIFDAGEGNFGYYNNDTTKPIKKLAYDVVKDISWTDALAAGVSVPNVAYTDKSKTFDKWDPAFPATITENKTFTAVSKAKDGEIYKIDDNNPLKDGDVEVQFRKGLHGSFSDTSIGDSVSYGVTPYTGKTLAEVLTELGNAPIKADTGYEFKSWDPAADETQINHAYQLTATYTALDDIRTVETPGYTKVEFKAGEGGSITGNSTFWVNPLKDIMLNAPAVKANVGKTLAGWSANPTTAGEPGVAQKYTQTTTYTAKYNDGDKVIIINPGETTPTDRYTVEFVIADADKDKASFSADSATKFGVLKDATTGINPPSVNLTTGYKLEGWTVNGADYKPSEDHKYTGDVTITAKIGQYADVIENNGNNEKPAGYLDVNFIVDPNKGTAEGSAAYFVKPGTAKSEIKVPMVTPKAGYKLQDPAWDKVLPETINESFTANALFIDPADVIPSTGNEDDKPEGYNTVTFESEDTNKGTVTAKETGKLTYWVNGKKPVKFTEDQIPTVSPAEKYVFGAWSINPAEDYVYFKDTTVKALFNNKVDVINGNQNKPNGWVTVTYKLTGENADKASLEGMTSYHVNPESDGVVLNPPLVKVQTGYALDKWTPDTTVKKQYTVDTEVNGTIKKLPDQTPDPTPGYTEINFSAGDHSTLKGTTTIYVNPETVKTFGQVNKPEIIPAAGYKASTTPWVNSDGQAIANATTIGKDPLRVTSKVELDDTKISETEKEGWYEVTFSTYDSSKGALLPKGAGEGAETVDSISKWVNPALTGDERVKFSDLAPIGKAKAGYKVDKWTPSFDVDGFVEKSGDYYLIFSNTVDQSNTPIEGYTEITFKAGENSDIVGAKDGLVKTYINPAAELTFADIVKPEIIPHAGYKASTTPWVDDRGQAITDSTKIGETPLTATSKVEVDDTKVSETEKKGWVKVTFLADRNSDLKVGEETLRYKNYWVNPTEKDFSSIPEPEILPANGYKVAEQKWNPNFDKTSALDKTKAYEFTAKTLAGDDVSETEVKDWTKITFQVDANKVDSVSYKENALTAKDGKYTKDLWVNPAKAVELSNYAPTIKAKEKITHTGWEPSIAGAQVYKTAKTVQATFSVDPFVPVKPGENNPPTPDHVKITFSAGDGAYEDGEKSKDYWALKTESFENLIKNVQTPIRDQYTFANWLKADNTLAKGIIGEAQTLTASYETSDFNKEKIAKIEVTSDPAKMNYDHNENLDLKGMKIKLTDNKGVEVEIDYNQADDYGISISPANGKQLSATNSGEYVRAEVKNADGNTISAKTTRALTVGSGQTPTPFVKSVDMDAETVEGKSSSKATIRVTIGDQTYEGTADDKGNFSIAIPKQARDTEISVTAEDTVNHLTESEPGTVKVGLDTSRLDKAIVDGKEDLAKPKKGDNNQGTTADKALEDAIKAGEEVKKDPNANSKTINDAAQKIEDAIKDKDELDGKIDELTDKLLPDAEAELNNPDNANKTDQINELTDAKTQVEEVLKDEPIDGGKVIEAYDRLVDALNEIKKPVIALGTRNMIEGDDRIYVTTNPGNVELEISINGELYGQVGGKNPTTNSSGYYTLVLASRQLTSRDRITITATKDGYISKSISRRIR